MRTCPQAAPPFLTEATDGGSVASSSGRMRESGWRDGRRFDQDTPGNEIPMPPGAAAVDDKHPGHDRRGQEGQREQRAYAAPAAAPVFGKTTSGHVRGRSDQPARSGPQGVCGPG
jgi:hypothetical protein